MNKLLLIALVICAGCEREIEGYYVDKRCYWNGNGAGSNCAKFWGLHGAYNNLESAARQENVMSNKSTPIYVTTEEHAKR